MKKVVFLIGIALVLQGCSYAISRDIANKADKTVHFEKLLADPESFKGRLLILGGTIAQAKNLKQGTVIEIVQKDLDYWGKPKRTDKTGGRFLVLYPGYLDTAVYAPGREITVAAEVTGTEQKAVGGNEFSYPLLESKELKLWERERSSWGRPGWWDPLYDPFGPGRRD